MANEDAEKVAREIAEAVGWKSQDWDFYLTEDNRQRPLTGAGKDGKKIHKHVVAILDVAITSAKRELAQKIFTELKSTQEKVVTRGGRDARSAEMRRRESIYVSGLDDACEVMIDICKAEGIEIRQQGASNDRQSN